MPPALRIDIVTLFPAMFEGPLSLSIVGKARSAGKVEIGFVDPRDFTKDRHRTVDDRPYGGGKGMVMLAQPLFEAIKSVRKRHSKVIYLSPKGKRFDQRCARKLAAAKHIVLVCGHYEGVDERIMKYVDMELSIGDYVLTGGEIPAMVVADACTRLLPGVLSPEATEQESFSFGHLEHPQYTRPRVWKRQAVPKVLLEGHHEKIAVWRSQTAQQMTRKLRPDLVS